MIKAVKLIEGERVQISEKGVFNEQVGEIAKFRPGGKVVVKFEPPIGCIHTATFQDRQLTPIEEESCAN